MRLTEEQIRRLAAETEETVATLRSWLQVAGGGHELVNRILSINVPEVEKPDYRVLHAVAMWMLAKAAD